MWKPIAVASACSVAWLAAAPSVSELLITVITASVAASTAYVIDDPAAVTLAASPTTLRRRRGQRLLAVVVALGAWWAVALAIITMRSVDTALLSHSLRLAAFVAIALATSCWADRVTPDGNAGTAGAVATLAALGSSFLPEWWLRVVPLEAVDGAGRRQLVVTALVAVVLVSTASGDPARRRLWARHR